ncbi:MAG: S8 family serine peptidase [Paludibacter sp.]|nr:S8 family serine peptidase [Paludibacter sp.]
MNQKNNFIQKPTKTTLLFFFFFTNILFADSYYFFIQFKDKNNTPYTLDNPSAYLSNIAIQRRNEQQIAIDSTDLPVNANYINQVVNQGVTFHSASKWMNGITVLTADSSLMGLIRPLSCVQQVYYTGKMLTVQPAPALRTKRMDPDVEQEFEHDVEPPYELEYGYAAAQLNQLNGKALHDAGYTGKNILIGVLDAGFRNVDINLVFDSLRIQNRLSGVKSIIDTSINVYQEDTHGANVLSIMAGNLPEQFVGVAPHASYWLIQTEYVPTEYMFEVDFWVRGLEFADSLGVDVINSSLGYTQFDDATMNFTYADMNGQVSRASRAAYLASCKGIIVCTSAGNEGNKTWKYISSPADADGILTVGAVNTSGTIAAFSSFGPTADNRIKPEVCATGWGTTLVDLNGNLVFNGNGTSYSSPIIAGLTACYLQYCKEHLPQSYSVDLIRQQIINSTDRLNFPDDQYGYGIPDFQHVLQQTTTNSRNDLYPDTPVKLKYQAETGEIRIIKQTAFENEVLFLQIITPTGKTIHRQLLYDMVDVVSISHLPAGFYLVHLSYQGHSQVLKILIP